MSYEFTDNQNTTISKLVLYMKLTAFLTAFLGVVDFIMSIISQSWLSIVSALSVIVLGFVFYFPIDNLQRIVTTQGSDIPELMQAFSDLNKGWTVFIIFLIIVAVLSGIGWFT